MIKNSEKPEGCIVLCGGGTAGHVLPNFALLPLLRKRFGRVCYIGRNEGIERELVQRENESGAGIEYFGVTSEKFRRSLSLRNLMIPYKIWKGVREARKLLREIKPDVVFSKGGFAAYPVAAAAGKLGTPVVVHESDLTMGLANRLSLKYCTKICTTFEQTVRRGGEKFVHTGSPVRARIYNGRREAVEKLYPGLIMKRNLLVLGGSLGAAAVNQCVRESLGVLCQSYNVIHVCGRGKLGSAAQENYVQIEYAENIEDFLAWADIVVSRAGSNALCELMVLKKSCLFIPLSTGRGDQVKNAEFLREIEACAVLYDKDLITEKFIAAVCGVWRDRKKLVSNIEKSYIIDGTMKVYNTICSVVRKT